MSRLSKFKRDVSALLMVAALIAIPSTDFTVKASAAEEISSADEGIVSNIENFSHNLTQYVESILGEPDFLMRAQAVDQAKDEAEKQIEKLQAELKAKAMAAAKAKAEAEAKAKAEAEAKAKAEAEEKAKAEAEEKAKAEQEKAEEAERQAQLVAELQTQTEPETESAAEAETEEDQSAFNSVPTSSEFLLAINNPDPNYVGRAVALTDYDRYVLEHLVMGEAGNQGFVGMALVAQSIRDTMIYDGYSSVESVRVNCGFYGSLSIEPSSEVKSAVSYIFDQGGSAVQHTIRYFYAYTWSTSSWHESMNYIVSYGDHKFFDNW